MSEKTERVKVALLDDTCVGDLVSFKRGGEPIVLRISKIRRWVSLRGTQVTFSDGTVAKLKWSQTVNLIREESKPELVDHSDIRRDGGQRRLPMSARLSKPVALRAANLNRAHIGSIIEFSTTIAIVYGRLDEVALPKAGMASIVVDGQGFAIPTDTAVRILAADMRTTAVRAERTA